MGEFMMSHIAFLEGECPGPSGTSSAPDTLVMRQSESLGAVLKPEGLRMASGTQMQEDGAEGSQGLQR